MIPVAGILEPVTSWLRYAPHALYYRKIVRDLSPGSEVMKTISEHSSEVAESVFPLVTPNDHYVDLDSQKGEFEAHAEVPGNHYQVHQNGKIVEKVVQAILEILRQQ